MSRHDDAARLRHMLDHAREVVAMVRGKERLSLDSDRMLVLAMTRLCEIVGEAASRVTDATRNSATAIPWREVVGMRNRIIHGYDTVDLDVLWDAVESDFPPLIRALEDALRRL